MYYELYGLKPSDLTDEQIKKVPSDILWRSLNDEPRFADEFVNRHKSLKEILSYVRYSINDAGDIKIKKVISFINELAKQEQDCLILQEYINILDYDNMVRFSTIFIDFNKKALVESYYPSTQLMDNFIKYSKYIDGNNEIFPELIKKRKVRVNEKQFRVFLTNIMSFMTKEAIENIMPEIFQSNENEPSINLFISNLLHASPYIPEKYHLKILRAIGKRTNPYFETDLKTKINPNIIKKLKANYRVNVLEALSRREYPFTHSMNTDKINELLFPCMFTKTEEIKRLMKKLKERQKDKDLPQL